MEDYARPKFSNRKCSWIRCHHDVRGRWEGLTGDMDKGWAGAGQGRAGTETGAVTH